MINTTNQLLGRIRRLSRKRNRVDEDLERAIVDAAKAGVSVRLIGIAADLSKDTVHRIVVRNRA